MAIKPTYDELEQKINKLEELEAERKQAEKMMSKEEFRYRTLFEAANDSIFIMKDYRFVECNKKTLKMFGCEKKEDIIGFYPWNFSPPNQPDGRTSNEKAIELMKAALEGKAQSFYWKHTQKGGREFDAEVSLNRLATDDTNLLLAIVRDITDSKQAERALRESEATLKSIFQAAPTGIGMVVDRIIKQANHRLYEMLGYFSEELLNKSSRILYPKDEDYIFVGQEKYKQIRMQGTGTVETQWQKKDGTVIDVLLSSTPIDTDDLSAGVIFTALDITDRKRIEQDKLNLESNLIQTQRMESIGVLAGGIAHDFNNILSPILANSEMVMMELPPDSPAQKNLQQICQAGERAKNLVKQILTFARKTDEVRVPLKVSMIIKEAVKFLRSTIPSTIDIRYDFKTAQDTVLADPTQMNQIIMNLCTNSFHAMRDKGGTLKLTLDNKFIRSNITNRYSGLNPGQYLKISVSDTGPGISPDIIEKIFEPYYTTKGPGEGTGMGLAMVHGIVKKYQGNITVESQSGKGTIFHILIPTIDAELSPIVKEQADIPGGKERILIVDDEKVIADVMQQILEKLGYTVTVRTSSIEALEAFRDNPDKFDLVITDMTMPNMTGKELTKRLMSIKPDIPIILCTGFSEQINEKEAKWMGIDAFVMKPIHIHEIAKAVRDVLNKA